MVYQYFYYLIYYCFVLKTLFVKLFVYIFFGFFNSLLNYLTYYCFILKTFFISFFVYIFILKTFFISFFVYIFIAIFNLLIFLDIYIIRKILKIKEFKIYISLFIICLLFYRNNLYTSRIILVKMDSVSETNNSISFSNNWALPDMASILNQRSTHFLYSLELNEHTESNKSCKKFRNYYFLIFLLLLSLKINKIFYRYPIFILFHIIPLGIISIKLATIFRG